MPRRPRVAPGGFVQHVLNRAAGKIKLLAREKDFIAFEELLIEAYERHPIRILAYCLILGEACEPAAERDGEAGNAPDDPPKPAVWRPEVGRPNHP